MLVENFTSYTNLIEKLLSGNYACLILKVGSERCPPCVALDQGPLEELTKLINQNLSNNKECLTVNINVSKHHGVEELFNHLKINLPDSIPAFYIFSYNNNKLTFIREDRGYDMQNPLAWRQNFVKILLAKMSEYSVEK